MTTNPYPEFDIDEVSGAQVPNPLWLAWEQGYKAGRWEVMKLVDEQDNIEQAKAAVEARERARWLSGSDGQGGE